jgi:hypothetical protein
MLLSAYAQLDTRKARETLAMFSGRTLKPNRRAAARWCEWVTWNPILRSFDIARLRTPPPIDLRSPQT